MKKIYSYCVILFFALNISNELNAQVIAGSVGGGASVTITNLFISIATCSTADSITIDIDCDSIDDMSVMLYKGFTALDGANTADLYILNSQIEICKDTIGFFSGYFGRPHYFSFGDTLSPPPNAIWATDNIYRFGDFGCMDCSGPWAATNKYFAYRVGGQVGWVKISFSLQDGGSCTAPVGLEIPSVLSYCFTSVNEQFNETAFTFSPNPSSGQIVMQTKIPLNNATISIENYSGQVVKEIKNFSGQTITLYCNNFQAGIYFVKVNTGDKQFIGKQIIF